MDPRRLDLARARREAKRLVAAARAGDGAATARLAAVSPPGPPRLADAQRAVARELGAPSWPALVRRAKAEAVARDDRARALVFAATSGRRDRAEALLAVEPGLAAHGLDAALVLGDVARVRAAVEPDRRRARAPVGARGWAPLLYA